MIKILNVFNDIYRISDPHLNIVLFGLVNPGNYFLFNKVSGIGEYRLSSDEYISRSGKGHLFQLQFWYYIFGGTTGELHVDLLQNSLQKDDETLRTAWGSQESERKWKYAVIAMRSDYNFTVSAFN